MNEFVYEAMTPCPPGIAYDAKVDTAARTMERERADTLVVAADPSTSDFPRLLTAYDIVIHVTATGKDPDAILASAVSQEIHMTAAPDEDLTATDATMRARRLRQIAIVNHGEIVGLLTAGDVVAAG